MPFIAIIAKENDSNFIKNSIVKNAKNSLFEIININEKNIVNMKNIKFDIVIIDERIDNFLERSNYISNIINSCKYVIINSDIVEKFEFVNSSVVSMITYGLNKKADFTISSVNDSTVLVCLQKPIRKNNNEILEEQEFDIIIKKNNLKKIHNMLPIFIVLCIYGDFLKKI